MAHAIAVGSRARPRRRWIAAAAALVVVLGVGAAACGGSSGSGRSPATTVAPEGIHASDAEVSVGFAALPALVDAAIAVIGTNQSSARFEAVFDKWETIEGTVKMNDADLYLSIEDELSNLKVALEDNTPTLAQEAKAELAALSSTYLAAHP